MNHKNSYLAGILDGEGHISINRRRAYGAYKTPRYSLKVSIVMCSKLTINWINTNYGGYLYTKKQYLTDKGKLRKIPYEAGWASNQALELLLKIRPYLITKAEEADIAINYQRACPPKAYKLSTSELNRRERAYQAIRKLRL